MSSDPMKLIFRIAAILAIASFAGSDASAQARQVVVDQMDFAENVFRADSYGVASGKIGAPLIGLLGGGARAYIELELERGREYIVSGACDADCSDLDLILRDEYGRVLIEDDELDDVPIISYSPESSGRFLLGITMVGCETDLCYFGYRIFEKVVKI